ncbi:MAG: tyrosine-type recombinase/integrase [Novosphingobium sp.]|nr:tyrosine-type recombinase/integrase [Novosphingobium sp.]
MSKLTKRAVDAAAPRSSEYVLWDGHIPGFGVRVSPSGRKSYFVQYRAGCRSRKLTLGPQGVLTPEQARSLAIQALAAVRAGHDPAEERKLRREAITVRELADRFDREHIAVRTKESTAKEYRRNLKRFIVPALGRLRVQEVSRSDIARIHHDLRHIPYQANRNLEIISKMFVLAELWGLRPDGSNPRRHIAKYPEHKRERFLSAAELGRLGTVLKEMAAERVELASAIAAVRLLLFTGCRLNEIVKLRWEHVDLAEAVLRLPDSKTGAKVVHLGHAAVDLLAAIEPRPLNPHVIVGTLPGKPLSDLQPFWQRVRTRAGLQGVRIHDLRHTFASVAVAAGQGLPIIGKLLGHSQVQTTARYAHLAADPVRAAANDVASMIAADMG